MLLKYQSSNDEPIRNFAPYLSGLLTVDRKPMTLENHFPFEETFSTCLPPEIVHRSSRQIGKTSSIAGRLILDCALIEGRKVLIVTPLQEQSDTLSSMVFKPMIENSPLRCMLRSDYGSGNVRRRDFINGSVQFFSYAGADTDRSRGKAASVLYLDEAQDLDRTHVSVLTQNMAAFHSPTLWVSGTSKTKDTFLEEKWNESSQGVWHVKCDACGFVNIACIEPEGHLLAMIGPYNEFISEKHPGTVCHRCRRAINPRYGNWVHRFPERVNKCVGFYAPQVIFPIHYAYPNKWLNLLGYMRGQSGYTTAKFYNEVLGEAYDEAYKLVTLDELKRAAVLGPNTEAEAASRGKRYRIVILGLDWGGGGAEGVSRTKGAAIGLGANGQAEVFFGFQFPPTTDRIAEAKEINRLARVCNAHFIAHDIGGDAGTSTEASLCHMGWSHDRLIPMAYVGMMGADMVERRQPTGNRSRGWYAIVKSKTLQYLCTAIKQGKVKFFQYDYVDNHNPGLLWDFLSLVEERVDTPTGGTYRIRRLNKNLSDDFTSAVNFGAAALWEYTDSWPSLVTAGEVGPRN